MKLHKIALAVLVIAVAGCATKNNTADNKSAAKEEASSTAAAELKTPTKDILVFEGDSNRAYSSLGPVEYKLEKGVGYGNTMDVPLEAQKQLKEGLKKVAFTKYGDKVDAIINVKMEKKIAGGWGGTFIAGFGAKNTMVSGEGIAVSYNKGPEAKDSDSTQADQKPKAKRSKKTKVQK